MPVRAEAVSGAACVMPEDAASSSLWHLSLECYLADDVSMIIPSNIWKLLMGFPTVSQRF